MAILNVNKYKNASVPIEYWERIADYLSCCDAKVHCLDNWQYDYLRWGGEERIYFDAFLKIWEFQKSFGVLFVEKSAALNQNVMEG